MSNFLLEILESFSRAAIATSNAIQKNSDALTEVKVNVEVDSAQAGKTSETVSALNCAANKIGVRNDTQ
jgi:fructoselysine-6-P-deglycase FrlB-like protein